MISYGLLLVAVLYFLLHLVFNGFLGGYGIFRDEFYYLACAARLDWGYVDHPPLAPLLLALQQTVLGDSLLSLRLLPALAGSVTILTTGLTARRMGGGKWAQVLAGLAVATVPVLMVIFGFFSMNAFEVLLWALALYVATGILLTDNPRPWLLFGLLAGLGMQNKHTFALFAGGLILGLLLHRRQDFRTPWLWLGGLLAGVIFLPNLIWEIRHGWPTLEFYANATQFKNIDRSPLDFLLQQILGVNPVLFPVWLVGLLYLLGQRSLRPLAWSFLLPLGLLMLAGSSRPDRLSIAYLPLLAAGAVAIEAYARHQQWRWLTVGTAGLIVVGGLVVGPVGFPILPPATLSAYAANFGLAEYEAGVSAELPQFFADRFGWEELVQQVAQVYQALPPEEQAQTALFTANYGQAGALEYFGPAYGLPQPISGHNNYWLWGPGEVTGAVVIFVGVPAADVTDLFESVQQVGTIQCQYCVERGQPILLARGAKQSIEQLWPQVRHFS